MSKRQETPTFLTKNEVKTLLDKAKSQSPRNYALLLLCYRHGLRVSEGVDITIENIDLEAGNIRCERKKGSISNWQQLTKDEVKAIKVWLRKRPKCDSPYLFVSARKKPLSRMQFFNIFRQLAQQVGLPPKKSHPHILKHSIATHLSAAGLQVQAIQMRLGHKNIQNTMVYTKISNPYVDRAFEAALANGAVV